MAETREEKLKRLEKGYRKSAGMEEEPKEENESPGILDRIKGFGKDVMDKMSEDIPESKKSDPRLQKHQQSIEREGIKTSMEDPEEMGDEKRSRRMRKLMLGLERPKAT